MVKVTQTKRTRDDGKVLHAVLYQCGAAMADTEDEQVAACYARSIYHAEHGHATLAHWNGDTGTETVLESK